MSGSINNLPDPPNETGPDFGRPNPPDESPQAGDSSTRMPLPDFNSAAKKAREEANPLKSSSATPKKLGEILAAQRSAEADKPAAKPVYKISAAEPDWSTYVMPPLADEESPTEESASTLQTAWAIAREVGETIILTLIIFFVIQMFIRNFRVVGTSMVNNLHDGQYLIIDKVSYSPYLIEYLGVGGPQRGDVIVFKPPRNPNDDYVKRVIGLPGEKVQVIKGQVYINDNLLEEPYQPLSGSYTMPAPVVVPNGQVFVLGDNRNNSNDSHNWGPLPVENIVGRAWISYWPPDQWGVIPRDAPTNEATLKHLFNQFTPSANAQNEQ